MSRDLALDLGTANILVFAKGEGIVLDEPSVIALDQSTNRVLALGTDAWEMIGRTPDSIVAHRPLRHGAITHFDITQRMIRLILQRVGMSRLNRPRVVICVPSSINAIERRAIIEAARGAGASDTHLIEQPMAAAIGLGLPVHEPIGSMVVDVGGGTTEAAIISLGAVVVKRAIRTGAFDLDVAIQNHLRRQHQVSLGERTAEEIRIAIGTALPTKDAPNAEIRGRDLTSGLPKTVVVTSEEVRVAMDEIISAIVDAVVDCLAQAQPELGKDVMTHGIHLIGGGGLIRGLARRISDTTDIPVLLAERPREVVAVGAGLCLDNIGALEALLLTN